MFNTALPFVAAGWLQQALTSKLTLLCAGIFAVCLIIFVLLLRASIRIHRAGGDGLARSPEAGGAEAPRAGSSPRAGSVRAPGSFISDSRGTTTVEFALVFPVLLILVLMMVQAMFLMAGNMYVHYAAFQAARHAIVEIPQDYSQRGDLGANRYDNSRSSLKYERIQTAACLALLPIAGRSPAGSAHSDSVVEALKSHYSTYGAEEPKWIDAMLAGKMSYATNHTTIEVLETNVIDEVEVRFDPLPAGADGGAYRFGGRDVITVRLSHELNLGVPFASRFFADGEHGDGGTGRFTLVVADASLTNEGVPVPLPEKPKYDRTTPPLPSGTNDPNDPDYQFNRNRNPGTVFVP